MDINVYNIEKKFPFKKKYYKDFSPVRSACLFVVKALTKLVEEMHNTVYFDFDQDGLILRATDKDALSKAKQRLEYWKDQTQIGILIDYIDKEDYKKFIDHQLQGLWKKEKAFINVISYDKFYAACEFLEKKGYNEPMKKYGEIMQQNKNFSLLMCTKHRFEEIKETITEILDPLRTDYPVTTAIKKKTSAPIGANNQSFGSIQNKQQSQKPISTTNNQQSMAKFVQKPMTWDDESSDSYDQNQKDDGKNQGLNILDINVGGNVYDNQFPDIGSGNTNNEYDPMFPQLQPVNNQKASVPKNQIIDSISKPTSTDTDQNQFNSNKKRRDVNRKSFDYDEENEDFVNQKPQSQFSNSQDYNYQKDQIKNNNLQQQQYESKESSTNQNYSDLEPRKFNFQLKFMVWLINSGIINQDIFQQLIIEEDTENDQFVMLSVNRELDINEQEILNLEKKIEHYESLTEILKMNIVLNLWPIETYEYLKRSNFFKFLCSQKLDYIDLFTVENYKKTNIQIKNNLIQSKSAQYLFQKMNQKKNFCFLIAPRKIFQEIKDQITQFMGTIQPFNIQNLYIDTYQSLVDYFPFQNIKKSRLQEIDNYYSSKKQVINIQQDSSSNLNSNNNNIQNNNNKNQQQQQQQLLIAKPLYKVSNENLLFVKKYKNQNEYDLLKICKNLRMQNFYQSSFIIQQFGIKVVQNQNQNNQNQPYCNIGDIYVFYENKQMNIQKAIQQKLLKTSKNQFKAVLQIIEAVSFLHTHIFRPRPHGNLKPENILFEKINDQNSFIIQLTDIIHDELSYNRFVPPEFFMSQNQMMELKVEKECFLQTITQQQKQLQQLHQQISQLQQQQNSINSQRNNKYNKNIQLSNNKNLLQQNKNMINQIHQQNSKQSPIFEQFLQNQNFIEKNQYNLIHQKPTMEADIWAIGLLIYSIFTGEVTDTYSYLLKSRQKIEQVTFEQPSVQNPNNNNNQNQANQKWLLKSVLKLVDEILQFEPQNRPNIFELQEKIQLLQKCYDKLDKKD